MSAVDFPTADFFLAKGSVAKCTLAVLYVGDGSPVPKRRGKDRPRRNGVSLRAGKPGPYGVERYFATGP